uniref:glucan 1,3-beta-glucosidase n=1 Tax=Albugo laibachii Nc14 TaxID=890382 RepID=F0WWZ3_9STRA|nr:hypothetical protein ALNC14_121230 [Albugo laibachii Nc14]|eukprot:CCA25979.1 hypothetical protein ALNC14_121230 [Albugo laibachii Nc14]
MKTIRVRCMAAILPFLIVPLSCNSDQFNNSERLSKTDAYAAQKKTMASSIIDGTVKMNAVTVTCGAILESGICRVPDIINDSPPAYNELAFMTKLGRSKDDAIKLVENLRFKWISQETIISIKRLGFNCIKIKFGYWLLDANLDFSSPKKLIHDVMNWATQHDLGVFLSFAAVPGCQNLEPVANCPFTSAYWGNEENVKRSTEFIVKVTKEYKMHTSFMAIGLLYAPSSGAGITNGMLFPYYAATISALRELKFAGLIMIDTLAEKRFDNDDVLAYCKFVAGLPSVWIAMSSYLYWDELRTEEQITNKVFDREQFLQINEGCPIFIDEWSMAFKAELTKDQLTKVANKQQLAYDRASKGVIFGPFSTTTVETDVDYFSYTSLVNEQIIVRKFMAKLVSTKK